MRTFVATWLKNPIFRKELRIGLRERRFVWLQLIYLGLACTVTMFTLRELDRTGAMTLLSHQGSQLNVLLVLMEVAALLLVAPALSSGAIALERERNNLELLVVGGASPGQIVAGKLMHSTLVAGLLLLAGLPLSVLALTLGGSSFSGLFWQYFILFWVMVLLVQYGLMISSRERRSGYATTQAYASLAVLLFGGIWLLDAMGFDPEFLVDWFPNLWLRWSLVAANLIFLCGFLFLKTVNHLAPKAAYSRRMGHWFLLWYFLDVAGLALGLAFLQRTELRSDTLWATLITVNLMFLGCFLNLPSFGSRNQQREFRLWFGSRPYVWVGVLSLGLVVAATGPLQHERLSPQVLSLVGLGVYLLFCNALIARSLHSLLGHLVPFRLIYFVWLGGVCGVAAIGLLAASDRALAPLWSLVYISPIYSTLSLTRFQWGSVPLHAEVGDAVVPIAILTLVFYGVVALVLGLIATARRRRAASASG